MQNNDKKVLLRISNLKQYFPLKGGRFVKANDGITLDIYEGETFGLLGESGCGKSTLGRTILQLYHQTYGRSMYYGRSLDDLAPKYVIDTVKNLKSRRTKLRELEKKRDELDAVCRQAFRGGAVRQARRARRGPKARGGRAARYHQDRRRLPRGQGSGSRDGGLLRSAPSTQSVLHGGKSAGRPRSTWTTWSMRRRRLRKRESLPRTASLQKSAGS